MKRPAFWDTPGLTWQSFFLTPASLIYGLGRMLHVSFIKAGRTPVPLICVGNVTVGGAQKISNLEGGLAAHYTLGTRTQFGASLASIGDLNLDGVPLKWTIKDASAAATLIAGSAG